MEVLLEWVLSSGDVPDYCRGVGTRVPLRIPSNSDNSIILKGLHWYIGQICQSLYRQIKLALAVKTHPALWVIIACKEEVSVLLCQSSKASWGCPHKHSVRAEEEGRWIENTQWRAKKPWAISLDLAFIHRRSRKQGAAGIRNRKQL